MTIPSVLLWLICLVGGADEWSNRRFDITEGILAGTCEMSMIIDYVILTIEKD